MDCWSQQTYPSRELLILDDLDCPAFSDVPRLPNVRLMRLPKMTVGEKRNIATSRAEGDVICHWDSDDWNPADRLETQIQELVSSGKEVCGWKDILFWDLDGKQGYMYRSSNPDYAIGTTLMYYRDWAVSHPFPMANIGEDNQFVYTARSVIHIIRTPSRIIAGIHSGNTSRKVVKPPEYTLAKASDFPREAQHWMFPQPKE